MRQRQVRAVARHGQEASEIVKRLRSIQSGSGHNISRIWDDWISSMALALANSCDRRPEVWQSREDEYMQIVKRHGRETMLAFAEMFALLVEGLDCDLPTDLLGSIYMALELGSNHAGQFFTPSSVCEFMARLTMTPEHVRETVEQEGFIAIHEPVIGGGATVIPMVAVVKEAGLIPSEHMHVVGIDIDWTVLRMAFVQLSLLGVPAVLYVGNTLSMEMREAWYTPAHILRGWSSKLQRRAAEGSANKLLAEVAEQARDTAETIAALTFEHPSPSPHPSELASCSSLREVIETLTDFGLEHSELRVFVLDHAPQIPAAAQLQGLDQRVSRILASL